MEDKRTHEDLDSSTKLIKKAALKRGIRFEEILYYHDEVPHEIYELSFEGVSHLVDITSPDLTSSIANAIADNKYLTHKMLNRLQASCARYDVFTGVDKALAFFESLQKPCVVKPVHGGGGDGVSVDIQNPEEFRHCFFYTQSFCEYVLVEEYFEGYDTRFLVIDGKIEAISRRDPAHVIGDGMSSLEALIDTTNATRADGRKGHLSKIKMDKIAYDYLKKKGISMQMVPDDKQKVYVRPNANLNTGGVSENITRERVSADTCQLIEKVASEIGLYVAGVDVISPDISRPLDEVGGVILEINDRPRIRMHEMPHFGEPVAVSERIVDMLFPSTKQSE